MNEKTVLVEL